MSTLDKKVLDMFSVDNFTLDNFILDAFRLDGLTTGGTTYDHSTPVQVVNAAYDTSGNGGRKLVRLSNGWLVAAAYSSGNTRIYFYKSEDNGGTWSQLCYAVVTASTGFALTSYGTNVYCLTAVTANTSNRFYAFDATTVSNANLSITAAPDSSQSSFGSGHSITVDSSGNLYAAWVSKNATYPNSFNIRHAKSVDGGTTWTKMDGSAGVDQITAANTSGDDYKNPCIVCMSNANPLITTDYNGSTPVQNMIIESHWSGAAWSPSIIYQADSYTQSNPCAVVSPDGHIHVTWHGLDSTDTAKYNIRYSESINNGANWSAMEKLTSGNTVDRQTPSIAADASNVPYIAYNDNGTLKWIKYSGSWSSPETIATGTNPSTCDNYTSFTKPMTLFDGGSDVQFYGVFTV